MTHTLIDCLFVDCNDCFSYPFSTCKYTKEKMKEKTDLKAVVSF